jgi:hypothetical protein
MTPSSTRVQPGIVAIDPAPAEDVEAESAVVELVASGVADVSSPETDRVFVEAVAASVRVRMDICAVVVGFAGLALLSMDCSDTSASETLAVGDSLLLLCVGTSIGLLVGSSVDSTVDSSVVVARTGSAVA